MQLLTQVNSIQTGLTTQLQENPIL
jgi:hypothetical protein